MDTIETKGRMNDAYLENQMSDYPNNANIFLTSQEESAEYMESVTRRYREERIRRINEEIDAALYAELGLTQDSSPRS